MSKKIKKIVFSCLLCVSVCLTSYNAFAQSREEYLESFLNNVYTIMLERDSDAEGIEYWLNKIVSEEIGILDFINQILDQDEFKNLQVTSEEFIIKTYNLLMDREPDEEGFKYWVEKIGTTNDVTQKLNLISQMAHSEEFSTKINDLNILLKKEVIEEQEVPENLSDLDIFVYDAYKYILGRDGDKDGVTYWKDQLKSKQKGALDLINEFILLEEFKSRNLNDEQFISAVYEVLFNRPADNDGLKYWSKIYSKDKSLNRMRSIVFDIADNEEFLNRIKDMDIILKKLNEELFYSEYLTKQNKIRGITSSQVNEIKKGMNFFDIIMKLGRTKNTSNIKGINIAKYIVDGSKELYFIFSDLYANYNYNAIDILKSQK